MRIAYNVLDASHQQASDAYPNAMRIAQQSATMLHTYVNVHEHVHILYKRTRQQIQQNKQSTT